MITRVFRRKDRAHDPNMPCGSCFECTRPMVKVKKVTSFTFCSCCFDLVFRRGKVKSYGMYEATENCKKPKIREGERYHLIGWSEDEMFFGMPRGDILRVGKDERMPFKGRLVLLNPKEGWDG